MKSITKELIFKSVYREIFYYADKKVIGVNYLNGSSNYTDDEYKKEEIIFCNLLVQREVDLCYVNTVNFDYIIVPEVQEWVKDTVNPVLIKGGLKKLAIVTSQQVFSRVSVRQMVDRFTDDVIVFETQYFTGEKMAIEWLLD